MKARAATLLLCLALLSVCAPAQGTPETPHGKTKQQKTAPAALRSECIAEVGLCVSVPASWQRLGDVFGALGFVAAEPRPGDQAGWPQLTVAALPPLEGSEGQAASLDLLVDRMLVPDESFPAAKTLQRRRLKLGGAEAELVRVQLPATGNASSGVIEQLALIDGGNGFVYSIALRCAPEDLARLEPIFQQAAASWHVEASGKTGGHTP